MELQSLFTHTIVNAFLTFRGAPWYPNLQTEADFTYKNQAQVIFAQKST